MSSTNRGVERQAQDGYMTRPRDIAPILQVLDVRGRVMEPCRGSGNIYRALLALPHVQAVDWCEIREGRDYLACPETGHDWTITNPPFSQAQRFIERAVCASKNVAMLLRLNFLESEERADWWVPAFLPSAIYVLANRPNFLTWEGTRVLGKKGRPGSDSCGYGWFVWSRRYHGIHVIKNPKLAA